MSILESHSNGHNRYTGVEWCGESQALNRAEEHFLRFIVDAKTAFPEHIQTDNRIHLVAEGLLKKGEVFRQNRKGLDMNRAKQQGRQDDEQRLDNLLGEVHSTGLFGQPKSMRDLLVDDTRVGPRVHEEI